LIKIFLILIKLFGAKFGKI